METYLPQNNERSAYQEPPLRAELEALTEDELDERLSKTKDRVLAKWSDCRKGYELLFARLNDDKEGFARDTLTVKLGTDERDGQTIDKYARVTYFREYKQPDGTYNIHEINRSTDGRVDYSDESWGLGPRSPQYKYSPYNGDASRAVIVRGEQNEMDVKLLGYANRAMNDKRILIETLELEFEPSIEMSAKALEGILTAAADPSLNPEFAQKLRAA